MLSLYSLGFWSYIDHIATLFLNSKDVNYVGKRLYSSFKHCSALTTVHMYACSA